MENAPGKAFRWARPINAPRQSPRPLVLEQDSRIDILQSPLLPGAWLQSAVAAEARIMTPAGPRPAGCLRAGDLVLTIDRGAVPLRWVGRRALSVAAQAEMPEIGAIEVPAHALGGGNPRQAVRVSPLAGLLLTLKGGPEEGVLVEAREMRGLCGIERAAARPVTYVQFLTDTHALIAADGLAIETLHPATLHPTPQNSSQRAEILACFPELEHGLDLYGPEIRKRAERRK